MTRFTVTQHCQHWRCIYFSSSANFYLLAFSVAFPSSVHSFKSVSVSAPLPVPLQRATLFNPRASKVQRARSPFCCYIFSTLLPVFWGNGGRFAAWLSVYIFFTRLYWNYNCVQWRLLLVACSVWRSCGPREMKKNGPLLRDSITEEENAAAHCPPPPSPPHLPFCFPLGANL